jgi:hypothetical protein
MSEQEKKVLQMLAEGKINVDEAQRLLTLVGPHGEEDSRPGDCGQKTRTLPRYIHVIVEPKPGATGDNGKHGPHGKVNIRVPLNLIRAGMKFATLMPSGAAEHVDRAFKEKGLSFDVKKLKEEDLQELISALEDSEINVDTERELVRIYSE